MTRTPALLSAAELAEHFEWLFRHQIECGKAPVEPGEVKLRAIKSHIDALSAPVGSEEVRDAIDWLEGNVGVDGPEAAREMNIAAASLLRRLTAPVADAELADRVRELRGVKLSEKASDDLVRWHWQSLKVCELAEKIARERDEAKAVLVRVADDLTCPRPHGAHYCSACDNSLFNLKAAVYAAIGRKEAEDTDDE